MERLAKSVCSKQARPGANITRHPGFLLLSLDNRRHGFGYRIDIAAI